MAVAFDANTAVDAGSGTVTSLTYSHTCTGSDRGLMGGAAIRSTTVTVSTFTYAGVGGDGAAAIGAIRGGQAQAEMWQFSAPASGANNFVITPSAGAHLVGLGCSVTGAHQTDCLGTAVTASTTGATSLSVTDAGAATDRLYVDVLAKRDSTEAPTADAGQANAKTDVTTNATGANNVYGGTSTEGGASSVTMGWSWATSRNSAIVMAGFIPAAAAATAIKTRKLLLGVGL